MGAPVPQKLGLVGLFLPMDVVCCNLFSKIEVVTEEKSVSWRTGSFFSM